MKSQHIPLNYQRRFIVLSLMVPSALFLLPFGNHFFYYLPNLAGMMLIYWLLYQPHRVGLGFAACFGWVLDILTYSPLGQHALAYLFVSYLLLILRPAYLLMHGFAFQMFFIGALLFLSNLIEYLIHWFWMDTLLNLSYWLPIPLSMLAWPLFNKIMLIVYSRYFGIKRAH